MLDFYPVTHCGLHVADFPLNHDCILKVEFKQPRALHYQYFTCRSQDSGTLCDIISKLFPVRHVYISLIDNMPDDF